MYLNAEFATHALRSRAQRAQKEKREDSGRSYCFQAKHFYRSFSALIQAVPFVPSLVKVSIRLTDSR
jgi:hypothetical protein